MELLEDVAGHMQKAVQKNSKGHGSYDDMLRLFAAMEAVPWQYRQEMGQWMLQRLKREDESVQTWWAIGRLAARQPLAANAHLVMPPEAAQEFLDATLAAGHEGVMAKSPTSSYEAGRRGAGWLKVKPVHTLDLVVLAVEWGSGRRTGKLSNIHLGALDPQTGGFEYGIDLAGQVPLGRVRFDDGEGALGHVWPLSFSLKLEVAGL